MVEKRVFDTILANFLRSEPSIRLIALVDKEGMPISFAIKSRKYKIKPESLGATIKQSFYPSENYGKNLNLLPLLQIYIMEQGCVICFKLGVITLGIVFELSGWPLQVNIFNEMLTNLLPQFKSALQQEGGLLSGIIEEKEKQQAVESISSNYTQLLLQALNSLMTGKIDPLMIMESAHAPEIFAIIAEKFDSFMVDGNNTILSMNPNYGPEFVITTKETIEIESHGLTVFNSGKILCGLSYFANKSCFVNGIVGEYNNQPLFAFKKYSDWSVGFNSILSVFYAIANYLVADYASDLSMNFIDTVIYLTDSIGSLKERINSYVSEKDFKTARKFMERAAILSLRSQNYVEAGDLYKWMGFTLYKEGEIKECVPYYEIAGKNHELGKDFEKAAGDCLDVANVLANDKQISDAIENYNHAEDLFKRAKKPEKVTEIQKLKNALMEPYSESIIKFIKNSTGETLTIDYINQKFNLNDSLIINILNQLIEQGKIGGEVDKERGRYTKTKITGRKTTPEPQTASTQQGPAVSGSSIGMSYSQIQPALANIEGSLRTMEKEFETMNVPFLKFIEYEKLLSQKQFLEHKRRIMENKDVFSEPKGENKLCFVCMKEISSTDKLSSCPSEHKAHQSCLSVWVKNQDACPVCDAPLFPMILRSSYKGIKGSMGPDGENAGIIAQMQTKIAELESQVKGLESMNKSLKEIKGDEKDYMEKIMVERDAKDKLEKELKKKDMTIRELKSMIKLFKQ